MTESEILERFANGRLAYRVSEAARLIDFGKSKLYELIAKGDVRTVNIGGQMRVPVTELLRLISPPDA